MDWLLATLPYGEPWRTRRKLFTQYLSPNTVQTSDPVLVDFIRLEVRAVGTRGMYESPWAL